VNLPSIRNVCGASFSFRCGSRTTTAARADGALRTTIEAPRTVAAYAGYPASVTVDGCAAAGFSTAGTEAEHDDKSSSAAATEHRITAAPRTKIVYPVTWAAVFTAFAAVAGFGVVAGRTVGVGVDFGFAVGFVVAAGFTVTFGGVVGFGVAENAAPAAPPPMTATTAAPIASFRSFT
jgi:hypothetical protein